MAYRIGSLTDSLAKRSAFSLSSQPHDKNMHTRVLQRGAAKRENLTQMLGPSTYLSSQTHDTNMHTKVSKEGP